MVGRIRPLSGPSKDCQVLILRTYKYVILDCRRARCDNRYDCVWNLEVEGDPGWLGGPSVITGPLQEVGRRVRGEM